MGRHKRECYLPFSQITFYRTGQVPQTGSFFEVISGAFVTKLVGSLVILRTHQPDNFWLKAGQFWNIPTMSVTLLTFQPEIFWLKALQP